LDLDAIVVVIGLVNPSQKFVFPLVPFSSWAKLGTISLNNDNQGPTKGKTPRPIKLGFQKQS
jgi:hypothetical protein